MTTITALPTPPSRDDSANFKTRADAFLAALPTFGSEANALAGEVNADKLAAAVSAAAALASELAAAASESATVAASNTTKWVSGTTYAEGDCAWSPVNHQTYRRRSAGGGTTDPASDTANWTLVGRPPAFTLIDNTDSPYTAANNQRLMVDTSAAAVTVTLPASPTSGDRVTIADYAGTFASHNLTIGRNAAKIMGLAEDMVVTTSHVSLTLEYIDATKGWAIV